MTVGTQEQKARRARVDAAVKLAAENRWEEAITANQELIDLFGPEVSALNRLGKAYLELGRYSQSREAYSRALELDPGNQIARKNLERLANLEVDQEAPHARSGVDPSLFVEETGKTAVVELLRLASPDVLGRVTAGDRVDLKAEGRALMVVSAEGERLGQVEPKLGLRLINFINGGNRYEAAVISIDGGHARVIIRETFQHPSQYGKVSFPPTQAAEAGFRGYIKGSVIHYETDEDEELYDESDYGTETETETEDIVDEHETADEDDHA